MRSGDLTITSSLPADEDTMLKCIDTKMSILIPHYLEKLYLIAHITPTNEIKHE